MSKIVIRVGLLLILAWAIGFLGILPSVLGKAQDVPFTASPEDVGVEYEEIAIPVPDEGLSLSAWWMPAADATSTILFVHGGNANKEDHYFGALDYYASLVARGHHVLAIDLRNHGRSDRTESGELAFGREEYRDVVAALTALEEIAPGLPVIGSGVSMGGATLIEAAARDSRLQALVLIDPLLDNASATMGAMAAITGLPKVILAPTLWSRAVLYGQGGDSSTPLEVASSLKLPILLIQDPDDPITRAEFAAELAKRNAQVTYHLLPPAPLDHPAVVDSEGWGSHASGYRVHPRETLDQIESFLKVR